MNTLFRIYFALNTLRLCKNLIKVRQSLVLQLRPILQCFAMVTKYAAKSPRKTNAGLHGNVLRPGLNAKSICPMQSVDSPLLPDFKNFPLGQRVTYRFYVGRLAVFDEDYVRPPSTPPPTHTTTTTTTNPTCARHPSSIVSHPV